MNPRPKRTAREIEQRAAAARDPSPAIFRLGDEASAMLARRGVLGDPIRLDLPFDEEISGERFEPLIGHLGRYAFRLFLRGAIQRGGGFAPEEATRYLSLPRATELAEASVDLGILERAGEGRVVGVAVGHHDMGDPLARGRPEQRLEVRIVRGAGVDHRHLAGADKVGAGADEGERAGVPRDDPADAGRDQVGAAVLELDVADVGDHGRANRGSSIWSGGARS